MGEAGLEAGPGLRFQACMISTGLEPKRSQRRHGDTTGLVDRAEGKPCHVGGTGWQLRVPAPESDLESWVGILALLLAV